jgi:hypothetical protein
MGKNRAFVRYNKNGKLVPGSLIITNGSYPSKPSLWKEIALDLCCETLIQPCDCECNNTVVQNPTTYAFQNSCRSYTLSNDPLNQDPISVTIIDCDLLRYDIVLAANGGPGSSVTVCAVYIPQYESSMTTVCNGSCTP